jgi:hypothetical protein
MSNEEIYYALWYHFNDGEKSTNAISKSEAGLIYLHNFSIHNPECMYHEYKKNIQKISVGPIQCYQYNASDLKLEPFNQNEISKDKALYVTQYCPLLTGNIDEVLVYLTEEEHQLWRELNQNHVGSKIYSNYPSFFQTELVSINSIIPDTYYEEGIMNAA